MNVLLMFNSDDRLDFMCLKIMIRDRLIEKQLINNNTG